MATDYKKLWHSLVNDAQLGVDTGWVMTLPHEFKRSTIFIRNTGDYEIPVEIQEKLRDSAGICGYQIRLTGKWATMADLRVAVGDVKFLWKKWIPLGFITLFAGEPKTGKSKVAQWLCKVVTDGLSFPDGSLCEPGNVIYIDAEGSQILAANSASDMGIDLNKMVIPDFGGDMLSQVDLNDEEHKQKLVAMIDDIRPSLIIIDSAGGAKSGGENRKEEMQPMMLFLNHLASEYQFAVVVIHHLNKTKREEDEEIAIGHVRGSTAIVQFSRSVLFLSRKPKGLKFWIGGSNVTNFQEVPPLKAIPIFAEKMVEGGSEQYVESFEFELWEDDAKTTKIDECQTWVIGYLSTQIEYMATARTVFEAGDEMWTTRTIKDAGTILERKGLIGRTGGKGSIWKLLQFHLPAEVGTNGNGNHKETTKEEHAGDFVHD